MPDLQRAVTPARGVQQLFRACRVGGQGFLDQDGHTVFEQGNRHFGMVYGRDSHGHGVEPLVDVFDS